MNDMTDAIERPVWHCILKYLQLKAGAFRAAAREQRASSSCRRTAPARTCGARHQGPR